MTNPVDIRPDHLRIVHDVLQDRLPAGVKVWVFGSRAQWSARDGSDLDLALEGETEIDRKVIEALMDAFEDSDLPFTVDVVDINRVNERFRQIVKDQWVHLTPGSQWIDCTLADACDAIDYGLTASASDKPDGPRFLRITDIVSGPIDWDSVPYVAAGEATTAKYRLNDGDIVIARTGASTGSSAYIKNPPTAVFASYLVRLVATPEFDPRFLAYYLQSPNFKAYINGVLGDKSAQPNASASTMTKAPLYAPRSKGEQRAIANVLGALDDKIDLNRRMNGTLEEMARALFKSWFVDFDPVRAMMDGRWRRSESLPGLPTELYDLFPARLVQTSMGDVPQGWKLGALTDMVVLLSGGTPKTSITEYWNGNIPWYTAKDAPSLSDVFVVDAERRISQAGLDNSSTQILPAGTTVITARGTVGRLACLGVPMAMNQTCYGIRGMDGYPDFFTYWNVRMAITELQARTHGTIFDTITRQTFRLVNVVIPPLVLATAFETEVAAFMNQILANLQASRNLAALRDLLLPNLMSSGLRESDVPA